MIKIDIHTGQKFGKLTVITEVERHKWHHRQWKCTCDCGGTKIATGSRLLSGQVKSCGCLFKEVFCLPPRDAAVNHLIYQYKRNAKRRTGEFALTRDYFIKLVLSSCHYCGHPPSMTVKAGKIRKFNGSFKYNGIDRIDNTKGYITDNVVSCCKVCNWAKGSMSYAEFKAYLKRVAIFFLQYKEFNP